MQNDLLNKILPIEIFPVAEVRLSLQSTYSICTLSSNNPEFVTCPVTLTEELSELLSPNDKSSTENVSKFLSDLFCVFGLFSLKLEAPVECALFLDLDLTAGPFERFLV